MSATGIGVAFVVLASIGLVATLIGILIWALVSIVKGVGRRGSAPPPTPR